MPVTMIPFQFPGIPQVGCAFTARAFGNISLDFAVRDVHGNAVHEGKAVQETKVRRASIPALLGVEAFAEAHQVHGVRTLFEPGAQEAGTAAVEDADGLATSRPGLALMVKTADCQPILFAHASGRYVMGIHSGWKGNRQDYPYIAVCEFCEKYGLEPKDIWAVRGPSLGPAASEFVNFEAEWGADFLPWYDGAQRTMDLWRLAKDQLCRAGLLPGRVLGLDICTFDNREMFFSYRAFRRLGVEDGRQASFIWIR